MQKEEELNDEQVKQIARDQLYADLKEQNLMPLITVAGDENDTMTTFTGLSEELTVELLKEALEEAERRLKEKNHEHN